jgi:transposase-like protein
VVKAYQERASLRGLARIFDINHHTAWRWIESHIFQLPHRLETTLTPAQLDDVLEVDEL